MLWGLDIDVLFDGEWWPVLRMCHHLVEGWNVQLGKGCGEGMIERLKE